MATTNGELTKTEEALENVSTRRAEKAQEAKKLREKESILKRQETQILGRKPKWHPLGPRFSPPTPAINPPPPVPPQAEPIPFRNENVHPVEKDKQPNLRPKTKKG
jgi:hypothetical protein